MVSDQRKTVPMASDMQLSGKQVVQRTHTLNYEKACTVRSEGSTINSPPQTILGPCNLTAPKHIASAVPLARHR